MLRLTGILLASFISTLQVSASICQEEFVEPKTWAANVQPFGRSYFAYTRLLGDGTLHALRANLQHFKTMGIRRLWISPVHPQTTTRMNETVNDHYYWTLDPGGVAQELGGIEALRLLVREATALGIEICLDTVLDHLGYTDKDVLMEYTRADGSRVSKMISPKDPRYFKQIWDERKRNELFRRIDLAKNEEDAIAAQRELARIKWDQHLPIFNFDNPEIREWLFESYRRFVDLGIVDFRRTGITNFRMDATKHLDPDFLADFIRRMVDYMKIVHPGKRPVFIFEQMITSNNYIPLQAATRFFSDRFPDADIYFFDFPKAYEVRRLVIDENFGTPEHYGFHQYAQHLRYRQSPERAFMLEKWVGDIENHDFLTPIANSAFNRLMAFMVSDFESYEPTMLFHGGEGLERSAVARAPVRDAKGDGQVAQMLLRINSALDPLRRSHHFRTSKFHVERHDQFVAEKALKDESLFLIVERSGQKHHFDIDLGQCGAGCSVEVVYQTAEHLPQHPHAKLIVDGQRLHVSTDAQTAMIVRVRRS